MTLETRSYVCHIHVYDSFGRALGSCVCAVPFILLTRGHTIHTHRNPICICYVYVCLCVCVCVCLRAGLLWSLTHTHTPIHACVCTNTCKYTYFKPIPKELAHGADTCLLRACVSESKSVNVCLCVWVSEPSFLQQRIRRVS